MKARDDDWKRLLQSVKYLNEPEDLVSTLEAEKFNIMKWYIDAAYAVHNDLKSHTGSTMTLGKGSLCSKSIKQKLNTKSSTKTELVGVDDLIPDILWTNYFVKEQGWSYSETIVYQDNKSAILLKKNKKASSSKRTKRINI